jgi:preprotein translocase subunit Sss1
MKAESVLMLFPMRKIAMEIMKNLKEHYRFSIIVLSPDDKEYYKRQTGAAAGAEVVLVPDDIPRFWREHAPLPADILSPVRNVINFMGNDWLTMDKKRKIAWINIAAGRHTPDEQGHIFCNTRYGCTGFLKSIELVPQFKNLAVVNICMNYFREQKDESRPVHCEHCVSERLPSSTRYQTGVPGIVSAVKESILR